MANEVLKRDGNRRNVMGAVTNDSALEIVQLRVDPITKRLLVDTAVDLGADIIDLTTRDALAVGIVDGNGDQITSFGGGTQYTEGDTDATITGTAALMEGAGNTLVPLQGSTTDGQLVNLGANNDVTITGSALTALQNIDTDLTTVVGHVDGLETLLSNLSKQEDTAHSSGDTGVMLLGVRNDSQASFGANGDYTPFSLDDAGRVRARIDVSNTAGDIAHDGADSGNPVKIGHKAIAHGSNPTGVAAGDRTDSYANRHGIPFMIGGHPNTLSVQANITDADGAQTNAALITVGAGTIIVVTWISVTCDHANTGDVQVRIGFGTANTPANDAAKVIVSHPGFAPGSGIVLGDGSGIIGIGADNEDLRLTCEDPAGGAVDIVVGYYTIES